MTDPLTRLAGLADMVSQTELSRLRRAMEARQKIEDQRAALNAVNSATAEGASAAERAGAGEKWQVWKENRLRALGLAEARAAAIAETRRQAACRAFGRAQVLSDLLSKPGKR